VVRLRRPPGIYAPVHGLGGRLLPLYGAPRRHGPCDATAESAVGPRRGDVCDLQYGGRSGRGRRIRSRLAAERDWSELQTAYTVSNATEDLNGRYARCFCPLRSHGFGGSSYGLMFGRIGFSGRVAAPEHPLFQSVPRQVWRSNC
jgi:hypothetical protein